MSGRDSIDLYHKQAADTGARIVPSCGFDSVPPNLNVYQLYHRTVRDGTGELCDTTLLLLRQFWQTGVSGGSFASYLGAMRTASADPEARRLVDDPYTLTTDRGAEPELGPQPDFSRPRGDEVAPEPSGFWLGGFVQGPYNSRIVRRTGSLRGCHWNRRSSYRFGQPVLAAVAAAIGGSRHTQAGDRTKRGAGTGAPRPQPANRPPASPIGGHPTYARCCTSRWPWA